jgi:Fe-S-cluster containining protein
MPFRFTRAHSSHHRTFNYWIVQLSALVRIPDEFRDEAARLFAKMDTAYDSAAQKAGFVCRGCEDNCCRTRFYHHTLMELLYLQSGLAALPPPRRQRIRDRADAAARQMEALERQGRPVRVMCPLNEQGRCILYDHRPMICRLHGIPNAMRRPDGRLLTGPGCDDFYLQSGPAGGDPLDRTPLYTAMADLERRLRGRLGFSRKIKLTLARMIMKDTVTL